MEEQIPTIQARISADEVVINDKIKELETYWSQKKPYKAESPTEALNVLSVSNNMVKAIKDDYVRNCKAKELLGMEFSDPNKLDSLEEDINDLREVWSSLNVIWAKIEAYKDTPFIAVIPEKIKKELDEGLNQLVLLPPKMRTYDAYEIVKNKIGHLKKVNTIISDLRTEAIKDGSYIYLDVYCNARTSFYFCVWAY